MFGINADTLIQTQNTKSYKILSTVLKEFANEMQFTYQKIDTILLEYDFLKLLKNHVMIKDIGAGSEHGEWSHWLQWYLLHNNTILTLKNTLSDLLALIGQSKSGVSIWNTLFDEIGGRNQNGFFSSPENIVRYLTEEAAQKKFPLLSTLITKRKLKREGLYNPTFTVFDDDSDFENTMFSSIENASGEEEIPNLLFMNENDEVVEFKDMSDSDSDDNEVKNTSGKFSAFNAYL